MLETLLTERLLLREWKETDLDDLQEMNQDDAVMRFFPGKPERKESKAFLERMKRSFDERQYCYFPVELRSNHAFVGFIGLSYQQLRSPFTPCVDIGWRLKSQYWGKGLAKEGATAVINYAFNTLDLREVFSFAPKVNQPSIKIMTKLGMSYVGEFDLDMEHKNESIRRMVAYQIVNPKYVNG